MMRIIVFIILGYIYIYIVIYENFSYYHTYNNLQINKKQINKTN